MGLIILWKTDSILTILWKLTVLFIFYPDMQPMLCQLLMSRPFDRPRPGWHFFKCALFSFIFISEFPQKKIAQQNVKKKKKNTGAKKTHNK